MNKAKHRIKNAVQKMPCTARVFIFVGILAFFLHLVCLFSSRAADFLGASLGNAVRTVLGLLSSWLPFSLAELLLVGLPLWILLAILLVRRYFKRGGSPKRAVAFVLSFLPLLYALFVFMLGFGYLSTPLDERLNLLREESIDTSELFDTGVKLIDRANKELSHITFSDTGESVMPLSYREMNRALKSAYSSLEKMMPFISSYRASAKAVLLSNPMAYTGITGVYSFFTGESNFCTYFPDYSTVYTAAHEMAHASGISREDEANFVAFLALMESDEPYLRYAACVNLLQYTLNALYRTDKQRHKELYLMLPQKIANEYRAYNTALDAVGNHPVRDVAESINNAYLSGVGTEGTLSYGLVVRLAVAYFKTE